jgi:sugar O-acyltransferase (sialic acid O-acetyltransferase NeuD family)
MIVAVAPQLAVNDENLLLVEWLKSEGDFVRKGEAIGVVETSKAVSEIEAEGDGYFRPVVAPGQRVDVHALLYVLTETREASIDDLVATHQGNGAARRQEGSPESSPERRWTRKAELLAQKHGVNIADVPAVGVVREADVERFLATGSPKQNGQDLIDGVYPVNRAERVLVIGGGRGAVQVLDILHRAVRQRPLGIVDDNPDAAGKTIMGVKILGTTRLVPEMLGDGAMDAAVIAFSNDLEARARIFRDLRAQGVPFANVVDPSVQIHANVSMGQGNVIIANSRLGACAVIGDNNFMSAFTNLEHHNVLGSHCTFGPGVMTSSRVHVGDKCRFGTGVFVEPGVRIGDESIIASGSVLTGSVPRNSVVKTRVETVVRPRGDRVHARD